jgi:predicted Zn-dependent protease
MAPISDQEERMTLRNFAAVAMLAASLLASACSGSGVTGPAAQRSDALKAALNEQPDMANAIESIDSGNCAQVLPLLTVYASQDDRTQLLDYLLGRSYACTADWGKALHHLRRSWRLGKELRSDIRRAARQAAVALTDQYRGAGTLSFPAHQAAAGFYAFGTSEWYDDTAVALLLEFSERQHGRGDYRGALRAVEVAKRIGTPAATSFEAEVLARTRLGQLAEVEALVDSGLSALPEADRAATLHRLAVAAEAAFRHEIAAKLYGRCQALGCADRWVGLALTRALLKAGKSDEATTVYEAWLAEPSAEEKVERALAVGEVLQRHDQFPSARDVLIGAFKDNPQEFLLAQAAAALHEKLPGQINVTALFSRYLKASDTIREALILVGDQCIEWRLPNDGLSLLPDAARSKNPDLVHFYRGAFQWLSARRNKANEAFALAVKAAPEPAEMLGRIADFMLQTGNAKEARSHLEKALKKDSKSLPIILKLATVMEDGKRGQGLRLLSKKIGRKATPASQLAAARWCRDRGLAADALRFARLSVKRAKGIDQAPAWLLLGQLLLADDDEMGAIPALEAALSSSTADVTTAEVVFAAWSDHQSQRYACFLATQGGKLVDAERLAPQHAGTAAIASLRCGQPDNSLLAYYIQTASSPAEAYFNLFSEVQTANGRAALAELEAEWPAERSMTSPLLEQLVLLFANLQDGQRTQKYAALLVKTGGAGRRDQYADLAARILPLGRVAAARELLRAAFEFGYAAKGGSGSEHAVTYAGLLFANGEDDGGMAVLKRMLETGFDAADAVAAATLLIDAGKPALAFDFSHAALERTADLWEEPAGLPSDEKTADPRKMNRADLMALLQQRPAIDPLEARRQLVGLAAFAWQEQGSPWEAFLKKMRPAVRPFNGEHLLAVALHRLDATEAALTLLADTVQEAPGDLQLFKAYSDALVYADHMAGKSRAATAAQLEKVARRFVKSRESDPDAYELAAAYLEGKGMFGAAATLLSDLADSTTLDGKIAMALARNQLSQGRTAEAATHFSLAAQLSACSAKAVGPIMDELERVARLDLAVDIIRECSRRFPKDAYLHVVYGRVLLGGAGGTTEDGTALGHLQKAVSIDAGLLEEAASLLHANGNGEAAWPFLEIMAKSKDPAVTLKALELGFTIASQKGDKARMTRLGATASRNHRDPQVASEMAGIYFKFNLPQQGLDKLKSAESGDGFSSLLLGIRLISTGDTAAGLKRLRAHSNKTLGGRKPDSGPMDAADYKPLSVQLDFLEDMGLDKEAVRLLLAALKVYPDDSRIRLRLMERLALAGRYKEAMTMVPRVVREWPGGEERKRLVRVLERFRKAGKLGMLRGSLASACGAPGDEGCMIPALLAAAMEGDAVNVGALADRALDSGSPAVRLADLGDELVTLGFYTEAEELLNAGLARSAGRPTPVLVQIHRLLSRIYSATGRRTQIADLNRLFLLHPATRTDMRSELPDNLVDYEYLPEALRQYRLLALTQASGLKAELSAFEVLLRKQDIEGARSLALRSAFRAESVLNGLLTYASLARRKLVFDIALELYQAAHELDPTNRALLFAVAELELVEGRTADGIAHLEEYAGNGPGGAARSEEIVRNLAKYNQLAAARRLAMKSGSSGALLEAGLNFLRAGQSSDGATLIEASYKAAGDPEQTADAARKVLTFAMHRPQLLPKTVTTRALELACGGKTVPAICRFWEALGILESGSLKEAVTRFDSQLEGSSETWLYTLAAVRALARKGAGREAEALLRKRMVGFNEAQVLNEAVKTVFTLIEEEPLEEKAQAATLQLGLRFVETLLEHAPYDFWFRTQRAELLLMAGQTDRALGLYENYLQETPWEPGIRNNLSYLLAKLNKDLGRGLELVQEALAQEASHSAFYLDTEGWLRYRMGDLESAERLIRSALLRSHLGFGDSLAESLFHLGSVQLAAGKQQEGIQTLLVASFLDPYGGYGQKARKVLEEQSVDVFGLKP